MPMSLHLDRRTSELSEAFKAGSALPPLLHYPPAGARPDAGCRGRRS